jgi:HK97 family phage major capsid protein
MPFNNIVSREDAEVLIPEEATREILSTATDGSAVLRLARRLPNMASGVRRLPVLSVLPQVYFVGEAGRTPQTFDEVKQTTEAAWENKFLYAEEIAAIIPIPENVLDDADYDIWGELRPQIVAAIGRKVDSAILYGTSDVDVPAAWPDGLMVQMPADHVVAAGTGADLYDDIFGIDGVIAKVEEDGFIVNGFISALVMRARLRALRDGGTGMPMFTQTLQAATNYSLDGQRLEFPRSGAFDASQSLLIAGDWDQLVFSIRKDITYKLLTEGVITDNATPRAIIHNLAQDDMVALRVTFRMAWQLPNPLNNIQADPDERFPFSALAPEGS